MVGRGWRDYSPAEGAGLDLRLAFLPLGFSIIGLSFACPTLVGASVDSLKVISTFT